MRLTRRQRDVVALLDAGLSCVQIARRLGIRVGTVRKHVEVIKAKLKPALPAIDRELPALLLIRRNAHRLLEAA